MNVAIAAAGALLFALAAWTGTLVADILVAGRTPHDDGPAPVAVPRWVYALAGGLAGALLALRGLPIEGFALALVVVGALAGAAAADCATGLLPDVLTLGPLALVAGTALLRHANGPLAGALFVAAPFAAAALFSRGRGMGWGDVKLAALGGALLGARDATLAFAAAAIVAYVVARRSGRSKRPIALGPYLALAIVATLALAPGS